MKEKKEAKNVAQVNISCDNVVFYKYGDNYMPVLRISVVFPETTFVTREGKTVKKHRHTEDYWMSPFRGYKFQVSASIDGHTDCGSTEVVGLSNILTAFEDYTKEQTNKSSFTSNVSYEDYLGTHSHIATQIYDAMIRSCLMKFTKYPMVIGERYDGYKLNLIDNKTMNYTDGGISFLDPLGYFAEIVSVYMILETYDDIDKENSMFTNIDSRLLEEYLYHIPVYDSNEVKIANGIKPLNV